MLINEIFKSLQGEGEYAGAPVLFVRLSGCTRNCVWCDSKYHTEGKEITVEDVADEILKHNVRAVVWTGGEPLIQIDEIVGVMQILSESTITHHLETNGDYIPPAKLFDYICISPKCKTSAINANTFKNNNIEEWVDIKVVTDLEVNKELIPYATILMPLSTDDNKKNAEINKKVWQYCVENNIRFSLRQHVEVWGLKQRGK